MAKSSIQVAYRDNDRTPLLYVLREVAARYEDLEVRIDQITGEEAFPGDEAYEQGFLRGDLDVICEHLRFLFPARRDGHPVRCFAACQNASVSHLVAGPGINSVGDLVGKTLAFRTTGVRQPNTEDWLRRVGLAGRVNVVPLHDRDVGRWRQWTKVVSGEAQAATCSPLYLDEPLAAGLHLITSLPRPSIGSLFFASLGPFISAHENELRRLVRSLYRALDVFHNDAERTLAIMAGEPARLMGITDDARLRRQYELLRSGLDTNPVPRLDALVNTLADVNEELGGLEDMNALMLWDLRYVLELEEERFGERLAEERAATV